MANRTIFTAQIRHRTVAKAAYLRQWEAKAAYLRQWETYLRQIGLYSRHRYAIAQ